MSKRHRDALAIAGPGACNPSGIAHAIIEACREMRAEPDYAGTNQIRADPAIRLMVYQLAFLCRTSEFDADLGESYAAAKKACEEQMI